SATLITFSKVREKNRDTMRISDITQLQNALATYYRDNDAYPALITSGQPLASGSITYILSVPGNRAPSSDGNCPSTADYTYTQDGSGSSYHIAFCLGNATSNLTAGTHYATPVGMY
ncbi:MAG: hypothetical protein V1865_03125, partial [bacterium]